MVITKYIYLICVVLFIVGLRRLGHPETARSGNFLAAFGMFLAIVITIVSPLGEGGGDDNYVWIVGAMTLGVLIGFFIAQKVLLTKMPEMVSLFNGLGGACSMLIAIIEMNKYQEASDERIGAALTILFALFIGSISFMGSLVAYGKLDGFLRDSIRIPFPQIFNSLLLLTCLIVSGFILVKGADFPFSWFIVLAILSLIYGVTFVLPIGGGDMPVVISLLNSFTGLAAAGAGFIYTNDVMIVGGILVGASGTFLTILMCKAMNRSLFNVIMGNFGTKANLKISQKEIAKEAQLSDVAIQLKYGQKILIVPGYGLAVAQAQHICHELEENLEKEGVSVKYAIHPIAGRMPGHMNVLLAEADVDYDKLLELEEANKEFSSIDVALIIGANDVVNPAAKEDLQSPIYGMPILEVEKAKSIIVLKRSMNPGYAGIQNQLFFRNKTKMLFGNAKSSLHKLKEELNNV